MRKILPAMTIAIIALPSFVMAQDTELLKNFKYRIQNYRAYDFSLNSSNYFVSANNINDPGINNNNSLTAAYLQYKSTDKLMLNTYSNLSGNTNLSKNGFRKQHSFSSGGSFGITARHYNNNNFFVTTGLSANISVNTSRTKQDKVLEAQGGGNSVGMSVTLGIGKGRAERITDMQNALWLNKALQENNLLTRALLITELNELGRAITLANNRRVLDSRRFIQHRLKAVDKFLQDKQVITSKDINYFNSLNDILFYAFNNERYSGKEWAFSITPGMNNHFQRNAYINNNTNKQSGFNQALIIATGYNVYVPKSLTRQINYGFGVAANISKTNSIHKNILVNGTASQTGFDTTYKNAGANLFYEWRLYPNTRTNIGMGVYTNNGISGADKLRKFYCSNVVALSLDYFISYNTRIKLAFNGGYYKNDGIYSMAGSKGKFLSNLDASLLVSL